MMPRYDCGTSELSSERYSECKASQLSELAYRAAHRSVDGA